MIIEILANAGQVDLRQYRVSADAPLAQRREHQQIRAANRPRAQNHLAPGRGDDACHRIDKNNACCDPVLIAIAVTSAG